MDSESVKSSGTEITDSETGSGTTTTSTATETSEISFTSGTFETRSSTPCENRLLADDILDIKGRQLRAEDPLWAVCPVHQLSSICLKTIADNILEIGIEHTHKSVSKKNWNTILDLLSLELPLEKVLPVLNDNIYWERRCRNIWELCDPHKYDDNWKRMFCERTVQECIEDFVPGVSDQERLDKILALCKNFVVRLVVKHLNVCSTKKPGVHKTSNKRDIMRSPPKSPVPPNHTDIGKLLLVFPYLEEISLSISPKNCGLLFKFEYYQFTEDDSQNLVNALMQLKYLKALRLPGCFIKYTLTKNIINTFLYHENLKELDLSFNVVSDNSCKHIAGLILHSCSVEFLKLDHNKIGDKGIFLIAAALVSNRTLKNLILSSNQIGDDGAVFLVHCLKKNKSLEKLNISVNSFGQTTGLEICDWIESSETLLSLNISGNSLGTEVGRKLMKVVDGNKVLKHIDVQLCDLGEEADISIRQSIMRNNLESPLFFIVG